MGERAADAIARLYDLDLSADPGDVELYLALAKRTGGPILELAAGSGRIAVPLAEAGHCVVGVDIEPAMMARARTRLAAAGPEVAERVELVEADMAEAAANAGVVAGGPYRLAILGLNSILIPTSADRQRAVVDTMARLLAPGGVAVVDVWLPVPTDLTAFDGRLSLDWLRTDPDSGLEVTKSSAAWFDPTSRIVTLTTVFEEGAPGTAPIRWTRADVLRLVTVDELLGYAADAGLQIEQVAGDHELGPLAPGSDRAVLLARKPPSA
ncbi:MAG TPA: class I SAM-dependent methyltransferase [Candidatus Limnocylindria bacterium]|nr:class I SAM-dependent methyltransferase [Candidatus Limnocylindria bacterium]